jgi:peptide/nickel transport system substrate-binding protein
VPKRYIEKVGDDGFKKAPIGAGPYRFISFRPGIELVLEAVESYWRKPPTIKRLVLRAIPEGATRLAALTRGEVDVAYHLTGELAEAVERTRGLTLKATVVQTPFWLYFPEQWDAKSPWHDQRVRLAAGLAINRAAINQAVTGGHSLVTGSIIPDSFEYFWQPPAPMFDPTKAKHLLAEAGFPNEFQPAFCR